MATAKLEYDITTPYTVTVVDSPGVTTNQTLRPIAALPHPNAQNVTNDINTIYLDPIAGSDANTGFTLALSKKTLAGALAAVTAVRYVIHIQPTTATESTLNATLGAHTAVGACRIIQVASGRACTLRILDGFRIEKNTTVNDFR